jgi:hypothetical protein
MSLASSAGTQMSIRDKMPPRLMLEPQQMRDARSFAGRSLRVAELQWLGFDEKTGGVIDLGDLILLPGLMASAPRGSPPLRTPVGTYCY